MFVTKGFLATVPNKKAENCRPPWLHPDFPRSAAASPVIWKGVSKHAFLFCRHDRRILAFSRDPLPTGAQLLCIGKCYSLTEHTYEAPGGSWEDPDASACQRSATFSGFSMEMDGLVGVLAILLYQNPFSSALWYRGSRVGLGADKTSVIRGEDGV